MSDNQAINRAINEIWGLCTERDKLRDEIERLQTVLLELVDYCEDHDWGTIPIGKTIEAAQDAVRLFRAAYEQQTAEDYPICPDCGVRLDGLHKGSCSWWNTKQSPQSNDA